MYSISRLSSPRKWLLCLLHDILWTSTEYLVRGLPVRGTVLAWVHQAPCCLGRAVLPILTSSLPMQQRRLITSPACCTSVSVARTKLSDTAQLHD